MMVAKFAGCGSIIFSLGLSLIGSPFAVAASGRNTPIAPQASNTNALNWITSDATTTTNLCHGYFQQRLTSSLTQAPASIREARTEISADSVSVALSGEWILSGNVVVEQPGRQLTAEKAVLYRDGENNRFTFATLSGDVALQELGKVIKADNASIDLLTQQAQLDSATLRFATEDALENALSVWRQDQSKSTSESSLRIEGLTARVNAETIKQLDTQRFLMKNASYTTCPPGHEAWRLQASRLKLSRSSGFGSATNVKLVVNDVPVFYWPYLLFPIDDRRRSGLLLPMVSYSKTGGIDFAQPLYLDLAPNYDFLLTPRYMQKRGVLWQGQFRYLNDFAGGIHKGRVRAGIITHDTDFNHFKDQEIAEVTANEITPPEIDHLRSASARRDFIRFEHESNFHEQLSWTARYHHVSDDYVLQDFGRLGLESTTNQLPQYTWLSYDSEYWRSVIEYSRYQTLHPLNKPRVSEQYRRQPRIAVDGHYPQLFQGVSLHFTGELVDFDRKRNPWEMINPEVGYRIHAQPGISYPYQYGLGGYITPRIDLALTHFDLDNIPSERDAHITRALPMMSVDAGLFFEDQISVFGRQYTHTLEPSIYYLYVPYRDQDKYPLFDTTLNMFTFQQLFRSNRFSGLDRIGDANQLTMAFTSRLLDSLGNEKAQFNIGGIIYFRDRDVALCQLKDGICLDRRSLILRELLSDTSTLSPIVSHFSYRLHSDIKADAGTAYDVDKGRFANGSVSITYQPNSQQFIQTGFNFIRGGDVLNSVSSKIRDGRDLKQFNTAIAWPVTPHWRLLGRYHYNISHEYTQDYLAGVEYENCCWSLRLVAGRSYKGLNTEHKLQYNRAIYLQWQMKGLATVGSPQPNHYLSEQLPEYEDTFNVAFPRFS